MYRFTGKIEECLKHFSDLHLAGQGRETWLRRAAVVRLVGGDPKAAKRWFEEFTSPIGENLVKLRFFLKKCSIQPEAPELKDEVRELEKMVAVGELTIQSVVHQVGAKNSDQVFGWLLKGQGISKLSLSKLEPLIEAHRQGTTEKLNKMLADMEQLGLVAKAAPVSTPLKNKEVSKPQSQTPPSETKLPPEVMLLAQLVNAAAPLAERLASSEFSAKDRQSLRQLTRVGNTNNVFGLSNSLNQCCGERARAQLESKDKE